MSKKNKSKKREKEGNQPSTSLLKAVVELTPLLLLSLLQLDVSFSFNLTMFI